MYDHDAFHDFYEDDEPIEDVLATFGAGPHAVTGPIGFTSYQSDPRCAVTLVMHVTPAWSNPEFMGYPMQRIA